MVTPIAQLLQASQLGVEVQVKGAVSPVQASGDRYWLLVNDGTAQFYAYGPAISGEAFLTGVLQAIPGGVYLWVTRYKIKRKELVPTFLIVLLALVLVVGLGYLALSLSFPDFHYTDLLPEPETLPKYSDIEKDGLTSYTVELLWNEGTKICAEIRNTGSLIVLKEDLEKIRMVMDDSTVDWNKSKLPDRLKIRKRFTMCSCDELSDACTNPAKLFKYEKVNGVYPPINVKIQPWYGTLSVT